MPIFIAMTLLAGAVVIGTGLAAKFWNSAVDWIKRAAEKVKDIVKKATVGVRIFLKKMGEAYKEISKHYSKNGTVWEETIVQRNCDPSEVPAEILEKAKAYEGQETDISKELKMQLSN